ncbi:MAG: hypothetical protein O2898_10600 [Proteobacteria bacterium]|nr:hypothetical protein [Pseudomonadota bacterium]
MTRMIAACMLVIGLAACGANGEPGQPAPEDGSTGVRVSGDARVGISVSQSGVTPHGQVALGRGPVWLNVGF